MANEHTSTTLSDAETRGLLAKLDAGGQELTPAEEDTLNRVLEEAEGAEVSGYSADPLVHRAILYNYARFGGLA